MRIHDDRFHGLHGPDAKQILGVRGEELIVELCEKSGAHAFRTVTSNHPIDVIINEEYGAEVRVFRNYRKGQVRMHKKMRNRKRAFCYKAGLKSLVVVIRATEEPYEYEVLWGPVMKGWRLENMSSFQGFLDKVNGADPDG